MSAIAGIDQALWDIKGKAHRRARLPAAWRPGARQDEGLFLVGGDRPSDVIRDIKRLHERGFDTFKMNGSVEMGLLDNSAKVWGRRRARIAEIREAFGNTIEFGIDFHGRIGSAMVKVSCASWNLSPAVRREPVLPSRTSSTRARRSTPASRWPLESGMYSRFEFKRSGPRPALAISSPTSMPAASARPKIAAMAEAYDVGPGSALPARARGAGGARTSTSISHNAVLQEQSIGIHYNQGRRAAGLCVLNPEDFRDPGRLHACP